MNQLNNKHFLELKNNIIHFKELSSFQFFLIKQLTKKQQIEIIMLYDEMLSGLQDLTNYQKITYEQKQLLPLINNEKRSELIYIYNQTIIELNEITNFIH